MSNGLRTIRIVKIENRGLHPDARAAEARGMFGITVHFDRMSFAAFHQHAGGVTAE